MRFLAGAVLILVPLSMTPGSLFYFDVTPKVAVLLIAAAAFLVLQSLERGGASVPPGLAILIGALWLSCLTSTILSRDPGLSLSGTTWRRLGLVSWTAILLMGMLTAIVAARSSRDVPFLLRCVAASGFCVAAYGILQWSGWDPWLPAAAYHIGDPPWTIVRPPGTLGYVTYFANYLLTVLFFSLGLFLLDGQRAWKVIGLMTAAMCATAIVLSGTRGAILGILLGGVTLLLWLRPRVSLRKAALALSACMLLGSAFYFSPAGLKLRSRARWYREDPIGGPRLWLWRDSARMGAGAPLFGFGLETFSLEFPVRQSPELSRLYPDFSYESPHNLFLDSLTGQGVPGLLVFVSLTAWAAMVLWRSRRDRQPLPAMLCAALVGTLTAHQFSCFAVPTALFYVVTIAMAASLNPPPAWRLPTGWPVAVLAVPISAALLWFTVRLVMFDRLLWTTSEHVRHARLPLALPSYEEARKWAPPGVNADLWYSRSVAQAALGTSEPATRFRAAQSALQAARRATQTADDRRNAWYNLAALSASTGDAAATEASLRSAIAAAPAWYKAHWTLARVLEAGGRLEEAETEAGLAVDLNGGRNPEVLQTFNALRARRLEAGKR